MVDNADVEFEGEGPIQLVVRWDSSDKVDVSGLVFDTNGIFLEAATFENTDALGGLVTLGAEVKGKGGHDKETVAALTVDWTQLTDTPAGFIGVLVNSWDKNLSEVKGCTISAEQNGVS